MKLLIAVLATMMAFSALAERVVIRKHGQRYEPGQKVFLKRELNRLGYTAKDYTLDSVRIVAEGRGRSVLMMDGQQVDIKGLIRDGQQRRNGAYAVDLQPRQQKRFQDGAWQIHFRGGHRAHYNIRRIVLNITPKTERVVIRMNGQHYQPGDKLFLKRMLNRQGYQARNYKLKKVRIVAEGRGRAVLMMNHEQVDIKGLIRDGQQRRNGAYAIDLQANKRPFYQNGPWQVHFRGGFRAHYNIRRVVLTIQKK